jgi:plasmid stability protein
MAQVIVRNLPGVVKAKLQRRAQYNGRTLEQEACEILSNAVAEMPPSKSDNPKVRLGTRIANLCRGKGLDFEIPELRGHEIKPATFEPLPKKRKKKTVRLPIIKSKRPGWRNLTNQEINEILFP